MGDELTIANYIGTDKCSECGKLDEVLTVDDDNDLFACQNCINKVFAEHWAEQPKERESNGDTH